jgi:Uma2 family endonuclease
MNPLAYYDPNNPYPESDGQPMAENTEQYDWLVKIKENLEILFADRDDVFVAGDLLWYPVADRTVSGPMAPDVMVAFGRPKGRRGAYLQWEEGHIAPQVVFEVQTPANSRTEMANKRRFYDQYGVEEYYVYDPQRHRLEIYRRQGAHLKRVTHLHGWVSPRLGVRFVLRPDTLELYHPNGEPFLTSVEMARSIARAEQKIREAIAVRQRAAQEAREAAVARQRPEQEAARADQEAREAAAARQRAEQEAARADQEAARAARLAERLRALGIDPEA